ncbi:hypothetical protein GCM10022232_00080 [Streptomyces plumbiresistens]|uniref:Uncharacterized protein n=1 Tax=Streptomyces plumbiresistens TaxID=511811 RepID=A0ABP7PXQ4_9ACTN
MREAAAAAMAADRLKGMGRVSPLGAWVVMSGTTQTVAAKAFAAKVFGEAEDA